jgi:hypothetical protein
MPVRTSARIAAPGKGTSRSSRSCHHPPVVPPDAAGRSSHRRLRPGSFALARMRERSAGAAPALNRWSRDDFRRIRAALEGRCHARRDTRCRTVSRVQRACVRSRVRPLSAKWSAPGGPRLDQGRQELRRPSTSPKVLRAHFPYALSRSPATCPKSAMGQTLPLVHPKPQS